jgi:hypothetical protein
VRADQAGDRGAKVTAELVRQRSAPVDNGSGFLSHHYAGPVEVEIFRNGYIPDERRDAVLMGYG